MFFVSILIVGWWFASVHIKNTPPQTFADKQIPFVQQILDEFAKQAESLVLNFDAVSVVPPGGRTPSGAFCISGDGPDGILEAGQKICVDPTKLSAVASLPRLPNIPGIPNIPGFGTGAQSSRTNSNPRGDRNSEDGSSDGDGAESDEDEEEDDDQSLIRSIRGYHGPLPVPNLDGFINLHNLLQVKKHSLSVITISQCLLTPFLR